MPPSARPDVEARRLRSLANSTREMLSLHLGDLLEMQERGHGHRPPLDRRQELRANHALTHHTVALPSLLAAELVALDDRGALAVPTEEPAAAADLATPALPASQSACEAGALAAPSAAEAAAQTSTTLEHMMELLQSLLHGATVDSLAMSKPAAAKPSPAAPPMPPAGLPMPALRGEPSSRASAIDPKPLKERLLRDAGEHCDERRLALRRWRANSAAADGDDAVPRAPAADRWAGSSALQTVVQPLEAPEYAPERALEEAPEGAPEGAPEAAAAVELACPPDAAAEPSTQPPAPQDPTGVAHGSPPSGTGATPDWVAAAAALAASAAAAAVTAALAERSTPLLPPPQPQPPPEPQQPPEPAQPSQPLGLPQPPQPTQAGQDAPSAPQQPLAACPMPPLPTPLPPPTPSETTAPPPTPPQPRALPPPPSAASPPPQSPQPLPPGQPPPSAQDPPPAACGSSLADGVVRRAHVRALAAAQARSRRGTAGASTTAPAGIGARIGGSTSRVPRPSIVQERDASGVSGCRASDRALTDLVVLCGGYADVHHTQMRRLRVASAWSASEHGWRKYG